MLLLMVQGSSHLTKIPINQLKGEPWISDAIHSVS